ncbi:thioredoxin family protein [Dyadobacter jiangsuensis]|uniref:Thioredoxin-like protein n=1 Tax=Dyadobacter jiangsuensis TaxID=1591085 RepID=A0A2P8FPL5_9BACT|nr:thioredoxin family protein [Dyadobacter jiangsuensis]PSL23633.1 thioredoxin-like protein [Dyadobacter jiangsuensis]
MNRYIYPRAACTLLIFFLFAVRIKESSAQSSQNAGQGIRFNAGTFQQALATAQKLNKPLFVEVFLKGCPHCEALAPVLQQKAAGDYYNGRFVSWKTEANSPESAALQKLKGVKYPEFPMLFFFDTTGALIHMATPTERATQKEFVEEIVEIGRKALDPASRTSGYAQRFEAGEHDLMFLIDYGKYCKTTGDNSSLTRVNDALAKLLTTPPDITSQAGFYVLQRLINDVDNPLSRYFFSHLDEFRGKYPAKNVQEAGEAILYHSLYGPKGDSYPAGRIIAMRHDMVRLGVPEADASARLLIKELAAHLREKNTMAAVSRFNEYRGKATTLGLADYAYITKFFNEKSSDNSYLPQMPLWAADGLRLAKPEELNTKVAAGLYYELCEAYWKMDKKAEASQNAAKALEIAKIAKDDLNRYEALINKVK